MREGTDSATTSCPGCGLELADEGRSPPDRYNASGACWGLFGELTADTISRNDPEFVHQHCVDAYGAQHPGGTTKHITTVFSLVGLYLSVERGYTGREVQQAHTTLGELERSWPELPPPRTTGSVTVEEVVNAPSRDERDRALERWTESVWRAWEGSHDRIRELCSDELGIDADA